MQIVSKNIKRLRLEKGLMQMELAKLAGISQNYLSQLERNKEQKNIRISTLRKLAEAFDCKVGNLTD